MNLIKETALNAALNLARGRDLGTSAKALLEDAHEIEAYLKGEAAPGARLGQPIIVPSNAQAFSSETYQERYGDPGTVANNKKVEDTAAAAEAV